MDFLIEQALLKIPPSNMTPFEARLKFLKNLFGDPGTIINEYAVTTDWSEIKFLILRWKSDWDRKLEKMVKLDNRPMTYVVNLLVNERGFFTIGQDCVDIGRYEGTNIFQDFKNHRLEEHSCWNGRETFDTVLSLATGPNEMVEIMYFNSKQSLIVKKLVVDELEKTIKEMIPYCRFVTHRYSRDRYNRGYWDFLKEAYNEITGRP
jgi:hypothetical protein